MPLLYIGIAHVILGILATSCGIGLAELLVMIEDWFRHVRKARKSAEAGDETVQEGR